MNTEKWGVYVHIPWCHRRCPYCAFYVEVERQVPWEGFVDTLLRHHAERRPTFPHAPPVSLFLGGGTPSRMPAAPLRRLVAGLREDGPPPGAEITAETNPEDAMPAWLDAALEAGVNRLSLGLQTLNPAFARLLNRGSGVREAADTARRVSRAGFRSWSADLIFALPGQSLADLNDDLDQILALDPPHVSLYGLTWEPGTPLTRARDEGRLTPVPDELWREMYDHLVERLAKAGLNRYEVSNFARDGHRSTHNQLYWSDAPYLGLGPGAHSYAPDGARWVDLPAVGTWMTASDPISERTPASAEGRAVDLLVSALRGVAGLSEAVLMARANARIHADTRRALVRAGLLRDMPGHLALADAGFPVADAVIRKLVDALVFESPPSAADEPSGDSRPETD